MNKGKKMNFSQAMSCLLANMSIIDGEAHEHEGALQARIVKNLGINLKDLKSGVDLDVTEAITWVNDNINEEGKKLAHGAIVHMAMADGTIHEKEDKLQKLCAEFWGIS